MKYYVKTAHGVSEGYIKFNENIETIIMGGMMAILLGPIGGAGQGGNGSPIIWLAILLILLEACCETNQGVHKTF